MIQDWYDSLNKSVKRYLLIKYGHRASEVTFADIVLIYFGEKV